MRISPGLQALANFLNSGDLNRRIAYDAAFADLLASGFELRLYQNNDLAAIRLLRIGKAAAITAGRTSVADMKETSMTINSTGFADLRSRQITGVGFFQQAHAGILAKAEIDLAMSGIDRNHTSRATLQETVGESPG